jgi:hypothetical protein
MVKLSRIRNPLNALMDRLTVTMGQVPNIFPIKACILVKFFRCRGNGAVSALGIVHRRDRDFPTSCSGSVPFSHATRHSDIAVDSRLLRPRQINIGLLQRSRWCSRCIVSILVCSCLMLTLHPPELLPAFAFRGTTSPRIEKFLLFNIQRCDGEIVGILEAHSALRCRESGEEDGW